MAIGLKHWVGIVGGMCILLVIAALPPRDFDRDVRPLPPAQTRYREVVREVQRVRRALVARRWVDSLSAVAVRDARDGLALGLPEGNEVTAAGYEEWRQDLAAQLDTLSRRAEGTVLGVFHQPVTADERGIPGVGLRATFAGTRDGTTYCLRVFPEREVYDADLRRTTERGLGACRLYAKYGMAGADVQRWLRAGNASLAARSRADHEVGEEWYGRYRLLPYEAPVLGMNRYGATYYSYGAAPVPVHGCTAGDVEACAAVLLEHGTELAGRYAANADALAITPREELLGWGGGISSGDEYLLSDLEREFGEEAFRRFWTSNEPVAQAFEAAFGLGAGEWMTSWVEAEIGWLDEAGPGLHPGTLLPTLLTFMLLAAGASLAEKRRRVG